MDIIQNYLYFNKRKVLTYIGEDATDITLSFNYYKPLVEEIKASMEARQWDGRNKLWRMKKTPRNLFVLDYLMGKKPYAKYDEPLTNFNNPGFWYHQNKMYAHVMQRKQVIIAGEMRTGKTRPVLKAIVDTQCDGAWWVAPKSALKGLKKELIKWNFPFKIYLMTYDKFRRIFHGSLEIVPKFIVFDECQKLKNPRSKQGQLARQLAQCQKEKYGDDRYLALLSGTPAPKDPSDWWNICEVACAGFLRESSKTALQNRLGVYEQREGNVGQKYWHLLEWKKAEVELLHKRLSGLVEVFLKKDCLDLPQKMYNVIDIPVSTAYSQAAKMLKDSEIQAAQLLNKLRQLSDGFQYIQEIDEVRAKKDKEAKFFPDCPKDAQLVEDLAEFEDVGRMIVYCGFQATLDKITAICIREGWAVLKVDGRGWHALNTTLSVDECLSEMDGSLNQGKIPKLVFCAQADAASTGLELSSSPIIIYYSNSFSGGARMQSEDRPHSNNMDKSRGLEIRDYNHIPVDLLTRDNLLAKKTLQSITMGDISASMKGVWNV